jgi:hypothetical protein
VHPVPRSPEDPRTWTDSYGVTHRMRALSKHEVTWFSRCHGNYVGRDELENDEVVTCIQCLGAP